MILNRVVLCTMVFVNLVTSVLTGSSNLFLKKLNIPDDNHSVQLAFARIFFVVYLTIGFLEIAFLGWSIKKISN